MSRRFLAFALAVSIHTAITAVCHGDPPPNQTPATTAPKTPAPEAARPSVKILMARFGANTSWMDVTQRVQEAVDKGETLLVLPETFGRDPARNVVKRLEVSLEVGGTPRKATVPEHQSFAKEEYETGHGSHMRPLSDRHRSNPVASRPAPTGTSGILSIKWPTDHYGAKITIDEKTPTEVGSEGEFKKFELGPGAHRIDLRRPGYHICNKLVDLSVPRSNTYNPNWIRNPNDPLPEDSIPKALMIKIIKAEFGDDFARVDVTKKVQETVDKRQPVLVKPEFFSHNPSPDNTKRLGVTYEVDGKPRSAVVGEGQQWTKEQYAPGELITPDIVRAGPVAVAAAQGGGILSIKWPDDAAGATIRIDGQPATPIAGSGHGLKKFAIAPAQHTIRISRPGFQTFERIVELSEMKTSKLIPVWLSDQGTKTPDTVAQSTATAPAASAEADPQPTSTSAAQSKPAVKIVSALWGQAGQAVDVHERVQRAIDNQQSIVVDSNFFTFDPFPGKKKTLEIIYERAGKRRTLQLDDGVTWTAENYNGTAPTSGRMTAVGKLEMAADQEEAIPKTVVELGEPAKEFHGGGGGQFLIFHLPKAGKLAIVDCTKSAVVKSLDVPGDVRFAAGRDKLLVVLPAQRLVERFSLADFRREKIAALPGDAPADVVLMGSNSAGPLALRGKGSPLGPAKLLLWDVEKMAPSDLPQNAVGGDALQISADGKTFIGWQTNISSRNFEAARLVGRHFEKANSPSVQSYDWWAIPTADGTYALRGVAGIYGPDMQPVSASSFDNQVLMPSDDPRLFLAARLKGQQYGRPKEDPSEFSIVTLCGQQTLYTVIVPEMAQIKISGIGCGYFDGEPRVRYAPALKTIATIPDSLDKVVIRRFDLTAMVRKKQDYLFVVSKPESRAHVGKEFTYRPQALTDAKSLTYQLEVAPPDAHIAPNGAISWMITAQPTGGVAKFIVSVSGDNDTTALHAFDVFVSPKPLFADAPPKGGNGADGPVRMAEDRSVASDLVPAGKFRLAASKAPLAIIPGRDGRSLLALSEDHLAILGANGIAIRKQLKLPKKYAMVAEREKYYVAIASAPQSIELIDKATLKVSKSVKLPGLGATDLVLHPTKPLAYIAYQSSHELPRFHFMLYDEESGDAHELEHCIGKWLQISPDGKFLIAGYSDIYQSGEQMIVNPDNIFFVPEYGDIDWVIRYDLKDPDQPVAREKQSKAGGNGFGLRMSADGKRLTYLSHVGYPQFSKNLGGWDPTDLHKIPVSYGTKDVASCKEFAFHPTLPLAASFGESTAVVFNRETGDVEENRVKLLDDAQLAGNIQRVYFTPDGRHLLFDSTVNGIHYLVQAELKLSDEELKTIAPPPPPPKPVINGRTT